MQLASEVESMTAVVSCPFSLRSSKVSSVFLYGAVRGEGTSTVSARAGSLANQAPVQREGASREESSQVQLSAGLGSPASGRAQQDHALPRPECRPAVCQNLSPLSSPLAHDKCRLET